MSLGCTDPVSMVAFWADKRGAPLRYSPNNAELWFGASQCFASAEPPAVEGAEASAVLPLSFGEVLSHQR
jgi:hypothetical protein